MPDGNQKLIEKPSNLISDLKVLIRKNSDNKFNQNVSMNSFEGKLLNLKTTSSSVEQNENILNEIINYIDERHSRLAILSTNQKKNQISHEIDLIESEISFLEEKVQGSLEANRFLLEIERDSLETEISKLKNDLPLIDKEINQLNQVIIEDSNNLNILKGTDLAVNRASTSPTLEQVISSYKSQIFQLTRNKYNIISDISFLSQKLDNLKKNPTQFGTLAKNSTQLDTLKKISTQYDFIFSLEQKQKTLENQLLMLASQNTVQTSPIMDIETATIKPKTQLTILLGLIIGFITGIVLIFIRHFVKSYKESEA
jgi:LPS O-antigen subunit length determinant protein (WzzB/FepE family)